MLNFACCRITAPPPPQRRGIRTGLRPWIVGLLVLITPKCLLCLAAWAGAGTAFGIGAVELCGATTTSSPLTTAWLLPLAAGIGLVALFRRSRRPPPARDHATQAPKP